MVFIHMVLYCAYCLLSVTQSAEQTTPELRAKSPELKAACYGADDLLENSFPTLTSRIKHFRVNQILPSADQADDPTTAKLQQIKDDVSLFKSALYKSNHTASEKALPGGHTEFGWMMTSPGNLINKHHGIDKLCDYLFKTKNHMFQMDRWSRPWTDRYYVRDYYTQEDLTTAWDLRDQIDEIVGQVKALTTRNFQMEIYRHKYYCRTHPSAQGCPDHPDFSTIQFLEVKSHPQKYNKAYEAKKEGQKFLEIAQHLARFANYHWHRVNGLRNRMSQDVSGIRTRLDELHHKTRRIRPKNKHFRRLRSKLRFGLKYLKRMMRRLPDLIYDLTDERVMVRDAERFIEDIRVAISSLRYQWSFIPRNTPHLLYRARALEAGHPARRQANHTFLMAMEKLQARLADTVRPVRQSLVPIELEIPKIREHRAEAREYSNISSYINTATAGVWYNEQNLQAASLYLCTARQQGILDRVTPAPTEEIPGSETEADGEFIPGSTSSSEVSSGDLEDEQDLIFLTDGTTEPTTPAAPACSQHTPIASTVRAMYLDCADSAMHSQDMLMDIQKGHNQTQRFHSRLAQVRNSLWQTRGVLSGIITPHISISREGRDVRRPALGTRIGRTLGKVAVTHEKLDMWLTPAIDHKKKYLKDLTKLLANVNSDITESDGNHNESEPIVITSSLEALHVRLTSLRQQTNIAMEQIRRQTRRVIDLVNDIQPVHQLRAVPKTRLILPDVINPVGLVQSLGVSVRTKVPHANLITMTEPGAGLRNDSSTLRLFIERGIPHLEWDDFTTQYVTSTKKRIDDDTWHHLQITRTGQLLKLVELSLEKTDRSSQGKVTLAPSTSMVAFPSHMELLTPLKEFTKTKDTKKKKARNKPLSLQGSRPLVACIAGLYVDNHMVEVQQHRLMNLQSNISACTRLQDYTTLMTGHAEVLQHRVTGCVRDLPVKFKLAGKYKQVTRLSLSFRLIQLDGTLLHYHSNKFGTTYLRLSEGSLVLDGIIKGYKFLGFCSEEQPIRDRLWHHVTVAMDSDHRTTMLLDGQSCLKRPIAVPVFQAGNLTIGGASVDDVIGSLEEYPWMSFDGFIKHVMINDRLIPVEQNLPC